eukprot:11690164-Karenia_brevis.AAC.1
MRNVAITGQSAAIACVDAQMHNQSYKFISAHLPHSGLDDFVFEGSSEMLQQAVSRMHGPDCLCFLGMDANAVIGCQTEDDDRYVRTWGHGFRDDYGHYFNT